MPPLRKKKAPALNPVCRVCSLEAGVLLDLFGSATQTISYAEDVNTCLSYEAKEGDGLPSKICIKCVGIISDCRPFVDKSREVQADRERSSDTSSDSSSSCYYCLSSNNILFPVPEITIKRTKDCFGFDVTGNDKVCPRCQFLLESLHDLKLKASEALKQFLSNSASIPKKSSPEKEESVKDIVDNLKDKFKMVKPNEEFQASAGVESTSESTAETKAEAKAKSKTESKAKTKAETTKAEANVETKVSTKANSKFNSKVNTKVKTKMNHKTDTKIETKVLEVKIVDIGRIVGLDFFNGTIKVSEYWERLDASDPSNKKKSSENKKRGPKSKQLNAKLHSSTSQMCRDQPSLKKTHKSLPLKKSRRLSKAEDSEEINSKTEDKSNLNEENISSGRKRIRELSDSECSTTSKKPRAASESEKSEKSPSPKSKKKLHDAEKKDDESNEHTITSSTGKLDESSPKTRKGSKKSKSTKKDKVETENHSNIPEKPEQPLIVRPLASTDKDNESIVENGLEEESTNRRKRSAVKSVKYSDDYEDFPKENRRKRKASNDEYIPKARGRKKLRDASPSDEDCGLDKSPGRDAVLVEQPDYLKDLDVLLKSTPRETFRPFICSVCHEGYVSTVKGKLHKLVMHDPHSSLVLQLTRCDDGSETMEEVLKTVRVVDNISTEHNGLQNGTASDHETDASEKRVREPINEDEDEDDLFADIANKVTASPCKKSNEELFDGLFGESTFNAICDKGEKVDSEQKRNEKETVVNDKKAEEKKCEDEKDDENDKNNEKGAKSENGNGEKKDEECGNKPERKDQVSEIESEKKEQVPESTGKKEEEIESEKKEEEIESEKKEEEIESEKKEEEIESEKKEEEIESEKKEEEIESEKKEEENESDQVPENGDDKEEKDSEKVNKITDNIEVQEVKEGVNEDDTDERRVETTEEETEVKVSETPKNDKEEATKSKEDTNAEETEMDELRDEANDVPSTEPTVDPELIEQNTKCDDMVKSDSLPVMEEVPVETDHKSPASAQEDKEDHEDKGSEADVESNGSGDENSEDGSRISVRDAGKAKGESSNDEIDTFSGSLKDVGEKEAERLPTCSSDDSFKPLGGVSEDCSEGIPVGDVCA